MPCDFVFRREDRLVVTRFRGHVTDAEFMELYETIYTHDDLDAGVQEVADLRRVESFDISREALETVDELVRHCFDGATNVTTIIAPGDLAYGIARMYGGISSGGPEQVRVFRTLEEAADALGLAPEILDRLLTSA